MTRRTKASRRAAFRWHAKLLLFEAGLSTAEHLRPWQKATLDEQVCWEGQHDYVVRYLPW